MLKYVLAIIGLLYASEIRSQVFTWRTKDGLSNEWISEIVQDNDEYIWLGTQYGLNQFDGYDFNYTTYRPNDSSSISSNWIRSLVIDSSGIMYLNCFYGGLQEFDPSTKKTKSLSKTDSGTIPENIKKLFIDSYQNLWVGSSNSLYLKAKNDDILNKIPIKGALDIDQTKNGSILITQRHSITQIDDSMEIIYRSEQINLHQIYIDSSDNIWVLSDSGLYRLLGGDSEWELVEYVIPDFNLPKVFSVTAVMEDHNHQLWIAGEQGINKISKDRKVIEYIPLSDLKMDLPDHLEILTFFEDRHHNIWVGTDRGLLMISTLGDRFSVDDEFLREIQNIQGARSILIDSNTAWVGTDQGLYRVSTGSETTSTKILNDPTYSLFLSSDRDLYIGTGSTILKKSSDSNHLIDITNSNFAGTITWDFVEDQEGQIWCATFGALNRYSPKADEFIHFNSANNKDLNGLIAQVVDIDLEDNLWVGSLSSGIYKLENASTITDSKSASFINYDYQSESDESLSNSIIQSMTLAPDKTAWIGTDGGLNHINSDGSIDKYLVNENLVDDKFMSLSIDQNNILWGSTIGHGIMAMNIESEETIFFDVKDGLKSNNYLLNSVYQSSDGLLFFGSDSETQIIDTKRNFTKDKIDCELRFISIEVSDPYQIDLLKTIPLFQRDQIELEFDQSQFEIEFSTIQYNQPEETEYFYRLLPLQDNWKSNGNNRSVNFSHLNHGNYTLEVKAQNPILSINPDLIKIKLIVNPPWWRSWSAYGVYLLILLSIIYFLFEQYKERIESRKLNELNNLKSKLYANITHEIRTPLTVILGLSSSLMKSSTKGIAKTSEIINRNGQHLLELSNRILDLSKIESGKMPINLRQGNIVGYIQYLLESFQSWAQDKGVSLHFLPQTEEIIMDHDEEIIKQIINNLISNAIKYCPTGSDIYCQISRNDHNLSINIRDNGNGIKEENIAKIFERFYQEESQQNSSGIGLAVTKELVQLIGGSISAKNNQKQGCTFSVLLPISNDAPLIIEKSKQQHPTTYNDLIEDILIIEDNPDIVDYIKSCLVGRYNLHTATDGISGFELCMDLIPDIVISDVMMPRSDGFELCKKIKNHRLTDHIPVVLLTAKSDAKSKKEGLQQGADAYLSKPFDPEELIMQIDNLLTNRRQLKEKYASTSKTDSSQVQNKFIEQITTLVESHLSDSNYNINRLCKDVGISRVHLHRKLKALTGESTSIFIRNIRLARAYKFLNQGTHNISEIAYDVGFSDPAYFSKLFTQRYGTAPSKILPKTSS